LTKRYILSIDGGGVRGIVAATLLDALEGERQALGHTRHIADCFDLIAGTSTGAIVAAGLAAPNDQGTGPRATPAELRDLYRKQARQIFPPRFWCRLPIFGRLRQFFGPLYNPENLRKVLSDTLSTKVFSDLRRNLYIGAYSIDPRGIAIFRGGPDYGDRTKSSSPDPDLLPVAKETSLVEVVMGSAAAPTFFPPHQINNPDDGTKITVVDGGLFINDPALAAYADAVNLFPEDEIILVSIGSGRVVNPYPFSKARNWGFLEWVSPVGRFRTPLISAISDGQARAVHKQMKALLGNNYFRFDYDLAAGYGSPNIDDASRSNLRKLEVGALKMAEEMRPKLKALAKLLS